MKFLVTRPQPDAERTASVLRAQRHTAVVAPLLVMQSVPVSLDTSRKWSGALLTSANAVRALAPHNIEILRDLTIVTVGERTADVAHEAGLKHIHSADGDGELMARRAAEVFNGAEFPVLYLAGENRAFDLAGALAAHGVRVETIVVYRMTIAHALPEAAHTAIAAHAVDGVLHYSRRTVDAYLQLAQARNVLADALAPVQYCLSAEIGAGLIAAGAPSVRIAAHPREQDLINLLPAG